MYIIYLDWAVMFFAYMTALHLFSREYIPMLLLVFRIDKYPLRIYVLASNICDVCIYQTAPITLNEVTGRTDIILFKPLHLRKWKESPPDTPGFSLDITPESFLHAQALGIIHRGRVIPQSEECIPIQSA